MIRPVFHPAVDKAVLSRVPSMLALVELPRYEPDTLCLTLLALFWPCVGLCLNSCPISNPYHLRIFRFTRQEWEFAKIERIPGYGSLQAS